MAPVCFLFSDEDLSNKQSDWLSTLFDVGGIIGEKPAFGIYRHLY